MSSGTEGMKREEEQQKPAVLITADRFIPLPAFEAKEAQDGEGWSGNHKNDSRWEGGVEEEPCRGAKKRKKRKENGGQSEAAP